MSGKIVVVASVAALILAGCSSGTGGGSAGAAVGLPVARVAAERQPTPELPTRVQGSASSS